jgi:tetratricopeptide (TPR) repeat protein
MKTLNLLSVLARRTSVGLLLLSIISLLPLAAAAASASPSELLEQGIYSEETKGDVDGAMTLYQQVVKEAKAGQAVAAQAQYRLGVCFYKKKNYAEANAAFEKLVTDYPDQKDLVALANKYLAGAVPLLPPPWVDGEEMQLDVKFPTGFKLGTAVYRVNADQTGSRKIWRLSSRLFVGTQQASRVEVEADTFKPLHSWWKINVMGEVDVNYFQGYAELKSASAKEPKKIDLNGVVFDNEEAAQLIRRLPLEPNYQTTVHIFSGLAGGTIVPLGVKVAAQEKVETAAGTFDCYKVELSPINQSFWLSTDAHRYLVKFEAGGVVAELTQVTQRKAGEPVAYRDPLLGFALSAPADWLFFRTDAKDAKDKSKVVILDPDAVATCTVNVGSTKSLWPEAQKSPRAWAEKEITDGEGSKLLKDLTIRTNSWKDCTVDGKPAVSVLGDFVEGKDKKVGYAVFALGNTNAACFALLVPASDFETFQSKFESIVDSYKEK